MSERLVAVLDALYDEHMKSAEVHRDIAIAAMRGTQKHDRHMRTAIAFKNRAAGVSDAKHALEASVIPSAKGDG